MGEMKEIFKDQLDKEWVELILAALSSGISPELIRDFLNEQHEKRLK